MSPDLPNNHLIFRFELHIEYEVATERLLEIKGLLAKSDARPRAQWEDTEGRIGCILLIPTYSYTLLAYSNFSIQIRNKTSYLSLCGRWFDDLNFLKKTVYFP